MDVRQLLRFVRIVDSGSLTRAAGSLRIAQPALTWEMARLESELGTRLLVRSAQGVRPTQAGLLLYRQARAVLRQIEQIPQLVGAADGDPVGDVRLGLPSILGPVLAPELVAVAGRRLPQVQLRLFEAESIMQKELVANSRVELALVYEHGDVADPLRRPLFRQTVFLLTQTGRRAAVGKPIRFAEAIRERLVLPAAPNPTRAVFDEALTRLGLTADIRLEMNSAPMLLAAVRAGIGSAVMAWTSLAAFGGWRGLAFRQIVEPELKLCVSLRASPLAPTSNAAHAVHEILAGVAMERVNRGDWRGAERLEAT